MSGIRALMVFKDGRTRERLLTEARRRHYEPTLVPPDPHRPWTVPRGAVYDVAFELLDRYPDFAFYEEV